MKKVIVIFLILISCLCLAVVSCADKEESSTSSSSTDNTTTVSIVDGSAEGYIKIGNAQIVWGKTQSNWSGNITYTEAFNETPNFYTGDGCNIVSNATSTGFSTSGCSDPITYLAIGKWQ